MYENLTWNELWNLEDETDPDIDMEKYIAVQDEISRRTDIRNKITREALYDSKER